MFHLKNLEILNLDPMLIRIAWAVYDRFGLDVITSGNRPGDKGVHGYFRGLDLRCRDGVVGGRIASWINQYFRYDPERPKKVCAKWKHKKGKGPHLHFKVHLNTVMIKQPERW